MTKTKQTQLTHRDVKSECNKGNKERERERILAPCQVPVKRLQQCQIKTLSRERENVDGQKRLAKTEKNKVAPKQIIITKHMKNIGNKRIRLNIHALYPFFGDSLCPLCVHSYASNLCAQLKQLRGT